MPQQKTLPRKKKLRKYSVRDYTEHKTKYVEWDSVSEFDGVPRLSLADVIATAAKEFPGIDPAKLFLTEGGGRIYLVNHKD